MNALLLLLAVGLRFGTVLSVQYVNLDISNIDLKAFTKVEESESRYVITPINDFGISDVVDGKKIVSSVPEFPPPTRKVTLERYTKEQYAGNTQVPLYDKKDEFIVVEIETLVREVPIRSRLFQNENGEYVEMEEAYEDFDVCEEEIKNFTKVSQRRDTGILTSYYATKGKRMGAIKCGNSVLLRKDKGIYSRYAEVLNQKLYIYTTPYIGKTFKTEFIPAAWEDCNYRRVDEGSYFVDLSIDPVENYRGVISACGENCLFFDGCSNAEFRIVDVLDRHGVIYMGHKAKCIDIKLQGIDNERYLAVYARLVDGTHESVLFKSLDDGRFAKYRPRVINLELTSDTCGEPIELTNEGGVKVYSISSPMNLKFTIGAVTYNGRTLVGKAFLDNPDKVPYMVLSRKITVDGEFTTIATETDRDYPTNTTYVTNEAGVWLYRPRPIQLNLLNLSAKNPNFKITQIGESNYHIATSVERTKIGTIRLGQHIIRPNQYHALGTEIVLGKSALLITTHLAENLKFYSRYVLTNGLFGESTSLFVEQKKEPLDLRLQDVFTGKIPASFCSEMYGSFVRVYLCKNMFMNIVGSVTFGETVVSPYSRYYEWREVYVSTDFFMSSVIVKSCTSEGECVVDSFSHNVVNSRVKFIRVPKIPLSIDLHSGFVPPQQISRVQDDQIFLYRIKPEYALYYRIGKIKYKGNVLVKDDTEVLSRAVNVLLETKENEPDKYTIRVADVLGDGRHSRLYTTDTSTYAVTEAKKKPLTIDVSFDAIRDVAIMMRQYHDTIYYYVPWTRACDYQLENVIYTEDKENSTVILPSSRIEGVPEISLHKDTHPSTNIIVRAMTEGKKHVYSVVKRFDDNIISVVDPEQDPDTKVPLPPTYGDV